MPQLSEMNEKSFQFNDFTTLKPPSQILGFLWLWLVFISRLALFSGQVYIAVYLILFFFSPPPSSASAAALPFPFVGWPYVASLAIEALNASWNFIRWYRLIKENDSVLEAALSKGVGELQGLGDYQRWCLLRQVLKAKSCNERLALFVYSARSRWFQLLLLQPPRQLLHAWLLFHYLIVSRPMAALTFQILPLLLISALSLVDWIICVLRLLISLPIAVCLNKSPKFIISRIVTNRLVELRKSAVSPEAQSPLSATFPPLISPAVPFNVYMPGHQMQRISQYSSTVMTSHSSISHVRDSDGF